MDSLTDGLQGLAYRGAREVKGSLIIFEGVRNVGFNEMVRVRAPDGIDRMGRVLDVSKKATVVQVFGGEMGLEADCLAQFSGSTMKVPLSDEVLGRMFNGMFQPIDGMPVISTEDSRDINGSPINPKARVYPNDFIQTGISCIDTCLSLVRGQKLPIFSESGLPHNRILAQISRQATVRGKAERFALVFAAMGLKHDDAQFFIDEFRKSGVLDRSVVVMNLADDPAIERLLAPKIALTAAEYLAFDLDMHVLVILSDMTNYAESLREMSAAREEVPGKGGYPGYLYSDLASIYERAGMIAGKKGSLTQMPILTMPGGDLRHPIPDLSGYITEGQVILDKSLNARGIYPPINILPSLSRLMRKGIGLGKTRVDHSGVSDQLYDAYSRGMRARDLSRLVGEMGLSEREGKFLRFADEFERQFLSQGEYEDRSVEESLDTAWNVLSVLPESELVRISEEHIKKYHPNYRVTTGWQPAEGEGR